ncbi:hypothetical protein EJ07DRAFT_159636 [Lizonia empirigonia]|nr:hypothetical protein EJ07DRAFT_159636 [Lizonia empirigonia]
MMKLSAVVLSVLSASVLAAPFPESKIPLDRPEFVSRIDNEATVNDASVATRNPTAEPKEGYRRAEGEALGFIIPKREATADAEPKEAYRPVEGEALGFSISKREAEAEAGPKEGDLVQSIPRVATWMM